MKRANGTGTVVKLSGPRRRPWAVRVSVRDPAGHIVQRVLGCYEKSAEAQAALEAYNRSVAEGGAPLRDVSFATLGEVFKAWSAREYRKLKPASIQSHNAAWRQRVSRLSDRRIRSITLDEWQSILDADEDAGLSQSLINNDALLIKALCRYAARRDILQKDYSLYLEIPSVGAKQRRDAFSELQLRRLEQLAAAGEPWADTALMLCYTGFRISELLALTPFSYHADGHYLQGGTKTAAGKNRIVPVHPKIRPYLEAWLARGGQTIVCREDGSPLPSAMYRQFFSVIAEKIGSPGATPHWCRHTFATLLHNAGADPLAIKWLLGHSTESDITEHYTHATLKELSRAISLIA